MDSPQSLMFSLCYTSRRPSEMAKVVGKWFSKASRPNMVEAILTVDADHPESVAAAQSVANASWPGKVQMAVQQDMPGNCVKGWNLAASLSVGTVLVMVADDFEPPLGWDESLMAIKGGWYYSDHCVHVSDGYNPDICTLGIITRKRYEKFGYFFYPGYESLFSDTELTFRAKLDGVMLEATHLLFEHIHPDCKKRARDAVDLQHASSERWNRGQMLFNFRQARGFPIDVGPRAQVYMETSTSSVKDKYACYMQAIKDDFCLYEVCRRMFEEGVRNFFMAIPDEYWSGTPTPDSDVQQVLDIAQKVRELGATVRTKSFKVAPYRTPNRNRIAVETCVRNESIQWIKDEGFSHILIVDSDELWRRGLMQSLDNLVTSENPTSIACGMVPVVGLPGFPVDSARDRVTIYMRGDVQFRECRSPTGIQRQMPDYSVIHFTGTRKTMPEIINKHTNSGHYDDPAYDFDGFLKNTLPNIRPGMSNIHFYRHYQIWPSIRDWYVEELEDIPNSIRPYISTNTMPKGTKPALDPQYTPAIPRDPESVFAPSTYTTREGVPKAAGRKPTRLDILNR